MLYFVYGKDRNSVKFDSYIKISDPCYGNILTLTAVYFPAWNGGPIRFCYKQGRRDMERNLKKVYAKNRKGRSDTGYGLCNRTSYHSGISRRLV